MNDQIMLIIIEQKLSHFNAIINVYMVWWVSSVVFCGSIIAAMWQQRDEIKDIKNINIVYFLILAFFITIINFGVFGVIAIGKEKQEIANILLQYNIKDVPLGEYFAAQFSVGNGTTSFIIIVVIWCLIWIYNHKNRMKPKD